MSADEYHEALLARIQEMQREIARLSQRDALNFAYLVSKDISAEAARMLVAEMLIDYWARSRALSGAP